MGNIIEMVFIAQFVVFLTIFVWMLYDTIITSMSMFKSMNLPLVITQWCLALIMFGIGMVAFLNDVEQLIYSDIIFLQAALLGVVTLFLAVNVIGGFVVHAQRPTEAYNASKVYNANE